MTSTSAVFSYNHEYFLFNGKPARIFSGELHYFRIPRPYWRHRLLMARAIGLNTVCIYMPWNLHEPMRGTFDFEGDGGMLDVAAFVKLAHELGLWVIVRPGPYICAEWDFGGLPGWLLEDGDCRVRCSDPKFIDAIKGYIARVGKELSSLVAPRGPIVMVQVENEYGSYADDKEYLCALRQMLRNSGFGDRVLYFTSDGTDPAMLASGTLDDCLAVANFGSKAEEQLGKLKAFRPNQPLMCGEFWCGWFDKWGEKRKGSADPAQPAADIRWMIDNNASFNIYMLHGGTNFGFTAGANFYDDYAPTVTSYDYWAPIDEAGRATAKFNAIRELLHSTHAIPPAPAKIVAIPADRFRINEAAPLMSNLPQPTRVAMPRSMECFGQYRGGAILYRTSVEGLGAGTLTIVEPQDYAWIFLDGKKVATLDRRLRQTTVELPQGNQLDILIWVLGRVNYGPKMLDRKGITERVQLKLLTLTGWDVFPLPMEDLSNLKSHTADRMPGPAFYRGSFELRDAEIGDTFLDMRRWKIGAVWVNGHNLGRFWSIGPQQTLYCPGCWLKAGRNEIVVFDLEADGPQRIEGLTEPILDDVPGVTA